jgi:hypothetical protein
LKLESLLLQLGSRMCFHLEKNAGFFGLVTGVFGLSCSWKKYWLGHSFHWLLDHLNSVFAKQDRQVTGIGVLWILIWCYVLHSCIVILGNLD